MANGDYRQSWERVPEGPKPEGRPVYTPSTEEVREEWASLLGGLYRNQRYSEFDRMIAAVLADAWDEGQMARTEYERRIVAAYLDDAEEYISSPANPYRSEKQ